MKTKPILQVRSLLAFSFITVAASGAQAQQNKAEYITYAFDDVTHIYRAVPQQLKIDLPHDEGTSIQVSCDQCKELKPIESSPNTYLIQGGSDKTANLVLHYTYKGKQMETQRSYAVKNISPAYAYFGGSKNGGTINARQLGKLEVKLPDEFNGQAPSTFEVTSWQLIFRDTALEGTGNLLTPDARDLLESAKSNEQLTMVVKYKSADDILRSSVLVQKFE